jgi:hypothetical protein
VVVLLNTRQKRKLRGVKQTLSNATMSTSKRRVPNGRSTRQSTVEAGNSWSRERLRETVGNRIECVAVCKTKGLVVNDVLTQPVITGIEMLHARRCDEGVSHLLATGRSHCLRTAWWDRVEEDQDRPE